MSYNAGVLLKSEKLDTSLILKRFVLTDTVITSVTTAFGQLRSVRLWYGSLGGGNGDHMRDYGRFSEPRKTFELHLFRLRARLQVGKPAKYKRYTFTV